MGFDDKTCCTSLGFPRFCTISSVGFSVRSFNYFDTYKVDLSKPKKLSSQLALNFRKNNFTNVHLHTICVILGILASEFWDSDACYIKFHGVDGNHVVFSWVIPDIVGFSFLVWFFSLYFKPFLMQKRLVCPIIEWQQGPVRLP